MESVTPLFQVQSIHEVLKFYQALGFTVTYLQERPYLYAAVQRGGVNIHFMKGTTNAICLVHVPRVADYHEAFADGLRSSYGKVPSAKLPRITRFREGQTRFTVYDPAGNSLIFINIDEPDANYEAHDDTLSPLMQVLEQVKFLRDTYNDDKAAARLLDRKLQQHASAPSIELARALAARAELAIALEDLAHAQSLQVELKQLVLSEDERQKYHEELSAAERLERWLSDKE